MTREQVLEIVDNCFHRFASSYRNDAEEYANELIDSIENSSTKNELRQADVSGKCCPICKSYDLVDIDDHYIKCRKCGFSFVE